MKRLRLMLEWLEWPTWILDIGQGEIHNAVNPSDLPISEQLKHDITKWNKIYQSTFDQIYPPYSGFSDKAASEALNLAISLEGHALYERLKEELRNKYDVVHIK